MSAPGLELLHLVFESGFLSNDLGPARIKTAQFIQQGLIGFTQQRQVYGFQLFLQRLVLGGLFGLTPQRA